MADTKGIKIIQTIASGGTAVMYKAVQTSLDRIVAVKRLHGHLTDDENFTRRFILEAKAAASLDHPNIVRVIDFGKEAEGYQMVMEFVEGESLKEVLERWRPIRHDLALAIVHQILLGLEHAHVRGIVHRDIKPGNVMLTNSGKVKITDFGLAKLTQAAHSHTADNSILGTPLYMSPEQAFGESVDQRSDLFSLGTVLYELITGTQPFVSENYMGVIQNIINKDIPSICDHITEIPAEVEAIVTKALSRDRNARFASAQEFRHAIDEYLGPTRLSRLTADIKVLLETNTTTKVMAAPSVDDVKPQRKSSAGRVVAAVFALAFAGGATAVALNPSLLDYVTGFGAGAMRGGNVQEANLDPGTYHFDMSEVVDQNHDPVVAGTTARRDSNVAIGTRTLQLDGLDDSATRPIDLTPVKTQTKDPEKAPREEPAPEKQKPVVRTGFLSINAQPSAEVYVDGVYKGDTPPQMRLELKSGRHKIECRHPRYETYQETLKITSGELSRRNVTLKKLRGSISLATEPGAELYVDGKLFGTTPIRRPIELDAGPHTLAIKKQGYFTWTQKVTVEAKQTLPLKITLSRQY